MSDLPPPGSFNAAPVPTPKPSNVSVAQPHRVSAPAATPASVAQPRVPAPAATPPTPPAKIPQNPSQTFASTSSLPVTQSYQSKPVPLAPVAVSPKPSAPVPPPQKPFQIKSPRNSLPEPLSFKPATPDLPSGNSIVMDNLNNTYEYRNGTPNGKQVSEESVSLF